MNFYGKKCLKHAKINKISQKNRKKLILRIFQCIFRSIKQKEYSGKMGECPHTATACGHSRKSISQSVGLLDAKKNGRNLAAKFGSENANGRQQ